MIDRDTIIKLAREAGFREPNPHDGCMGLAFDYRDGTDTGASLQRFAALVAAHAKSDIRPSSCRKAVLRAREEEREACASIADAELNHYPPEAPVTQYQSGIFTAAEHIAAAIRARSQA